jgi:hypothetical protein
LTNGPFFTDKTLRLDTVEERVSDGRPVLRFDYTAEKSKKEGIILNSLFFLRVGLN